MSIPGNGSPLPPPQTRPKSRTGGPGRERYVQGARKHMENEQNWVEIMTWIVRKALSLYLEPHNGSFREMLYYRMSEIQNIAFKNGFKSI